MDDSHTVVTNWQVLIVLVTLLVFLLVGRKAVRQDNETNVIEVTVSIIIFKGEEGPILDDILGRSLRGHNEVVSENNNLGVKVVNFLDETLTYNGVGKNIYVLKNIQVLRKIPDIILSKDVGNFWRKSRG